MNPLIQQIIGEARDYETRTYTVNARPDHLDELEKFFSWVNSTRAGHSGAAELVIDGDGAARVTIEKKGGELKKHDEDEVHTGGNKAEYKVCLESQDLCRCQNCGHVFDDRELPEASMGLVRCPKCSKKVDQSGRVSENAVIVKQRPADYYVCPHCGEEIHEKGSFSDDGGDTLKHGKCGGVIEYPETPLDDIADWLRPYIEQSRAAKQARQTPPAKGFVVGDTTASTFA